MTLLELQEKKRQSSDMAGKFMLLSKRAMFLCAAVFFTMVNVCKVYLNEPVRFPNLFWQTVGIVGFITLQWLIKE